MDMIWNGRNPEWASSQMDTILNEQNLDRLLHLYGYFGFVNCLVKTFAKMMVLIKKFVSKFKQICRIIPRFYVVIDY